ncbi:hypothetical protein [Youngiibacter multivorans]|uniref:DNA-binding MarR family transcriptional regulator n=1 Tax=Youngiibacter multivorans TaxID=937251 RepID=A0ABS4G8B3_9CLOT|nr:hypothetical protein [Youngiibacter multivorans]MBP1920510.1 DNA-binding MarR family transcriptional regulator [Youngiibacter multivorans]
MKEYLEQSLKRKIEITVFDKTESLPLQYVGLYHLHSVNMDGVQWLIAEPKEKPGLASMRKNQRQLEKLTGLNCALYLKSINSYSKDIMVNEGIPFIVEGKQIYLPFIGVLLATEGNRALAPVSQVSFLTQRLLILALYGKWQEMTVTKIAESLGMTKMSVSRCLDEIEYLEIPVLALKGKSRVITINRKTKELWEEIQPILRNPVIITYDLEEDLKLAVKAGMSALCEYSMLEDNPYPTYAITKKDLQVLKITKKQLVPRGEEKGCAIQVLGYYINFQNRNVVDPLTVLLSLSDEEKSDDRVKLSVDEMLREYAW